MGVHVYHSIAIIVLYFCHQILNIAFIALDLLHWSLALYLNHSIFSIADIAFHLLHSMACHIFRSFLASTLNFETR